VTPPTLTSRPDPSSTVHDVVAQSLDELFGLRDLGCRVRNHEHHGGVAALVR
jgi:hypothetical protein